MNVPKGNILDLIGDDHDKKIKFMVNAIIEHRLQTEDIDNLKDYVRCYLRDFYNSDNISYSYILNDFNSIFEEGIENGLA